MRLFGSLGCAVLILGSSPAFAQGRPARATALSVMSDGEIVVRFEGMRGREGDWIALATPGSPPAEYVAWQYTDATRRGALTFAEVPAGDFVARAYFGSSSYVVRAESAPFRVPDRCGMSGVTRSIVAHADGDDVFVRFASPCGRATDWVALAPLDAPAEQYGAWRYTDGVDQGTFTFPDLPPGRWVARLFTDWSGTRSYAIRAQSAPLCVAAPGQVCGDLAAAR